jgi:hypothetical protein
VYEKRFKTVRKPKPLGGYESKRVPYTAWLWLGSNEKWFYVKNIGSVVDGDVAGGYGIMTSETHSYKSVGAGGKTVSVIEVRDKNGAPLK